MQTVIEILQVISMPVSILIAVLGFARSQNKDAKSDGAQAATMLSDIGYIKSGIDDVKAEQRQQRQWNETTSGRLSAAEANIGELRRRIGDLHDLRDR